MSEASKRWGNPIQMLVGSSRNAPSSPGQCLTPSPLLVRTEGSRPRQGQPWLLVPRKEVVHYSSGAKTFLFRDPGYSLDSFALSWSATRSWRPGCCLSVESLSTCAHLKCSTCLQPSLTKQVLAPAKPLCSEKPRHPHQTWLAQCFLVFVD